jgi:hypothetical protein
MSRRPLLGVILLVGCGGGSGAERTRSPSLDYPPPPTRTSSDGEGLGADRERPEDRLQQGARIGSEGPLPADHPYGRREGRHEHPPPPRPCHEVGLRDAEGKPHCPEERKKPER